KWKSEGLSEACSRRLEAKLEAKPEAGPQPDSLPASLLASTFLLHFQLPASCFASDFRLAVIDHFPAAYDLLNPFRAFVTVNDPSLFADTLIQYARPLCAGGGGAPRPAGASTGAIGIVVG